MNAPLPNGLQASLFGAARRLHIQHGPTDLIIDADGPERLALFEVAVGAMRNVLSELADELPLLRTPWNAEIQPTGEVARRMHAACALADGGFVTPMAAVAGAISDHVLDAMLASRAAATATKINVNNGGDIAFWTADGAITRAAIAGPLKGGITLHGPTRWRGMATSGRGGRSLSPGIADSVTVLAVSAAEADVAATLIAGGVDCPDASGIERRPARDIDPDSDLGDRAVTIDVAPLHTTQIDAALDAGRALTRQLMQGGRIAGAVLELQGAIAVIGLDDPAATLTTGRHAEELPVKGGELTHA